MSLLLTGHVVLKVCNEAVQEMSSRIAQISNKELCIVCSAYRIASLAPTNRGNLWVRYLQHISSGLHTSAGTRL